MLIRCPRLKKIHYKVIVLVLILSAIALYLKHSNILSGYYGERLLTLSGENYEFERRLRKYESRIIANLGSNGEPSYLYGRDREEGEKALKSVALNTVLSDRMPLNRTLKDPRHKK